MRQREFYSTADRSRVGCVVGNPQRPCQPVSAARQQDRPEAPVEIEFGLSLAKVLNFRTNGYFGVESCANLFFCARRSCCF
jgi:hypothetical protein